jgi:hypothetical protein
MFDLDNSSNTHHDFHRLKRYVEDILARKEQVLSKAGLTRHERKNNVVSIRRDAQQASLESKDLVRQVFGDLPPGILADVWIKGRCYYAEGLSGPSQRADAIYSIGHYLFYGDPEIQLPALGYGCEQDRQWLLEEILSSKHNGQSGDINRGRSDALVQVRRAAHWRPAARQDEDHTPYSIEVPISWVLANDKRKKDARVRIKQAVQELKESGRTFTASDIQTKAKCSWRTLYKHEDLWKQDYLRAADPVAAYDQIAGDIFAISTGQYNAVVGQAAQESLPCPQSSNSDVPPGLLACRRVAYELEMRGKRNERKKVKEFQEQCRQNDLSWRNSVVANMPSESSCLDLSELKCFLAFLIWMRASAPDYESEFWITELILRFRDRIDACAVEQNLYLHDPPWTG